MSGLEVTRALIKGELPAPPPPNLCGIRPVEAEEGKTKWAMPASERLCAPVEGRLYGGDSRVPCWGTAIDSAGPRHQ